MRVVVTGGTGFIGRNLVEFLATGRRVDVVVLSRSRGFDVLDPGAVLEATKGVDIVYHLAAYAKPAESILNPSEAFRVNVWGTLNLLEACRRHNFSMVYVSTCEIYGDSRAPIKEDHPINPPNPYAASKAAADRICYSYHRSYGLDVKILRLFNPYGPYQQLNKVIPTFYFQARRGEPLTVYGDGSDTRDYTYIKDVVDALWRARRLPAGEVVNVCTGVATPTLELAKKIIELTGSSSSIVFTEYPALFGGIRHQVGSPEKARRVLGWRARYTIEDGLRETIKWLEGLVR